MSMFRCKKTNQYNTITDSLQCGLLVLKMTVDGHSINQVGAPVGGAAMNAAAGNGKSGHTIYSAFTHLGQLNVKNCS